MTKKLNYVQLPGNVEIKKVQAIYDTFAGGRRNPASAEMNRYGRTRTNVEGGEEWQAFFVDQGIDPVQPWITTGTNKAQGLIFMYAAASTDPGAIEVKWDPDRRVYSTHFGAAIRECPAVRPITTVEVQWQPSLDKEGKPCLALNVKAAKPKRKGAADVEQLAARAEEEAAKKAVKANARKRIAAAKQGTAASDGTQSPEGAKAPPTEEQ